MRKTGRRVGGTSVSAIVVFLAAAGCELVIPDESVPTGDAGRPVEQVVTIAFRNLATTDAVNVEFHTTTDPAAVLPQDLFVQANEITANLGVAGTGLLIPGATDVLEIPCDASLVIGTAGGVFVDNETGETTGRGVPRWLDATSAGLCGAIVGFTFAASGDTFLTSVEIRR
jgi:hypothetical protein